MYLWAVPTLPGCDFTTGMGVEMNHDPHRKTTRREALCQVGTGMGMLGLFGLLGDSGYLGKVAEGADVVGGRMPASNRSRRGRRTSPPRPSASSIYLNGGPSQVDTFDPKPILNEYAGQTLPLGNLAHRAQDRRRAPVAVPLPEVWPERHRGQRDVRPDAPSMIDDMCVIRSMHADMPNHEPSMLLMNCGDDRLARPSLGSWVTYGLGTENQNLPGFIAMCPGGYPIQESQNWQSAFLPGVYQGTYIDTRHSTSTAHREHPQPP